MESSPTLDLRRRYTALVIDDCRAIRRMVIQVLRESGHFKAFLEARDGAEGLGLAASHRPDLVLCDLDMPILDGFRFLARFRADPRNEAIPVVMLSARDHGQSRARGMDLGANAYVAKPFDAAELRARVRSYLRVLGMTLEPTPVGRTGS